MPLHPRFLTIPILLSLSGFLSAGCSFAQTSSVWGRQPARLLIGGFFPVDGGVKKSIGTAFNSFGAGYDFYSLKASVSVTFEAYIDYDTKSRLQETANVSLSNLGAGISTRAQLMPSSRRVRPYIGIGAGYYDEKVKASPVFQDENIRVNENFSRLGGKLQAGCEFTLGLFAEADYNKIGGIPGTGTSGYRLRLGCRF